MSPAGPPSSALTRQAWSALVIVQLLFGAFPVIGKLAIPTFGAGGVCLARIAGAAVFFQLLRGIRGAPSIPWAEQPRVLLCSMLGIASNQLLFLFGLARTTATHAAVLTCLIPAMTLLAATALGRERPRARQVFGVATALAGALLLATDHASGEPGGWTGDAMIVANTAVYAVYLVLSRDLLARHPPASLLAWLFTWAVIPVLAIVGAPAPAASDASATWALLFIVLGPTIGSYWLNLVALRRVPASVVAIFVNLQPLLAAVLARVLLREELGARTAAAAILTLVGVAVASKGDGAAVT
jgi:drug/metabolite transporter (DMT)-like permease